MMSVFSYLKTMNESDLSMVHDIEQSAYDFPWSLQGFEKSLDQGLNYLFCNEQDSILGYCCILPVLDEAHILNICVSPKFQRQGIARDAFTEILQRLKDSEFKVFLLEVRESNAKARALYQSLGFTEDGVRKGYYRAQVWNEQKQALVDTKENAILMSYRLPSKVPSKR